MLNHFWCRPPGLWWLGQITDVKSGATYILLESRLVQLYPSMGGKKFKVPPTPPYAPTGPSRLTCSFELSRHCHRRCPPPALAAPVERRALVPHLALPSPLPVAPLVFSPARHHNAT